MSSSIIDQDYPYDILHRGQSDEHRHNKRVNDAVRKQLKDIISQQDIISSEGNRKVKIKIKNLDQYRFTHNKDYREVIGRDEYDDLDEGELIDRPEGGDGREGQAATDDLGEELYEAEYTIEELTNMMIEELELPDLDEKKKNQIVSEVLEWTDRRKKTGVQALIDKRKTILANILRKAKIGSKKTLPIINDDLRYRTWDISQEKHSNAVIFLMMDRSASMSEDKIFAAKALYFWIVQFLKRKYDKVEIKFIAHDFIAREMSEKDFFSISQSGGTRVSSAYTLCRDLIQYNYPSSVWNIYCFHVSDGDSWNDENECISLVEEIINLGAIMFAYTEIAEHMSINEVRMGDEASQLYMKFKKAMKKNHRILISIIHDSSDILSALQMFLKHSIRTQYS